MLFWNRSLVFSSGKLDAAERKSKMKMSIVRAPLLLVAAFLLPKGVLQAQTSSPFSSTALPNITLAMAKDDVRLDQKITITRPDICLGELLEQLSAQTKIDFNIDPDSTGSGVRVLVRFRDTSLREIMNALWSVVSYKNAEWAWDRHGTQGSFTYTLIKTRKSESLSPQIEAMINKKFEHYVDLTLMFSRMTPTEREARQEELYEALMWRKEMNKKFNPEQWSDDDWTTIKLLDAMLTKPELLKLINGGVLRVPLQKAPARAQELFKKICEQRSLSVDGLPQARPTEIVFDSYGRRDIASPIFPMLFIRFNGHGTGALSGGVLELGFRKFIEELWRFPEEKATNDLELRGIPPLSDRSVDVDNPPQKMTEAEARKINTLRLMAPVWQRYFLRIGEGADISVCALVRWWPGLIPAPDNHTIYEVLHPSWDNRDSPVTKWRGNVLLASYLTWYQDAEGNCSYRLIKEANRVTKKHLPSAAELAYLQGKVNDEQWEQLQARSEPLRRLSGSKTVLAFAAVNTDLTRPNGMPLTEAVLDALPATVIKAKEAGGSAVRLQSVRHPAEPKNNLPESFLLELQVLDKNRKWQQVEAWEVW